MNRIAVSTGYESLAAVLDQALDHAQSGKGKARHASGEPFIEQPIVAINDMLGSTHGALFQAIKKARESVRLKPGPAVHELLGAINYLAAAVIILQREEAKEVHGPEAPDMNELQRNIMQWNERSLRQARQDAQAVYPHPPWSKP